MRAQIVTPAGERIDGDVANLTATGMLLLCGARLRIGQSLTAKLLSHSMPAQVLFVSEAPEGVVVSLRPNDAARDKILEAAPSVDVVAPKDELWSEDTSSTNVDLPPEAMEPAPLPADVEVLPIEEPVEHSSSPHAIADDLVFDSPVDAAPASSTDAAEPINPVLMAAASMDDDVSVNLPAEDMTPMVDEVPEHVEEAVAEAGPQPGEATLPTLGADGHTVRFESSDAYVVQYTSNIEHGGLVVRANALPIGTQRMLALEVPGSDKYTVSARVIYHQDGKVGFMLDSFNIHKARLKQLGG